MTILSVTSNLARRVSLTLLLFANLRGEMWYLSIVLCIYFTISKIGHLFWFTCSFVPFFYGAIYLCLLFIFVP